MDTGINTKKLLSRTRRARKNLTFKLVLEEQFTKDLEKYFEKLERRFFNRLKTVGDILPREMYKEDTIKLLENHYIRVSKVFKDEFRSEVNKSFFGFNKKNVQIPASVESIIDDAIIIYTQIAANERGKLIDDTTEKNMEKSVSNATNELVTDNEPVNYQSISTLALIGLNGYNINRIETIALTETQLAAERTKAIEATAISLGENSDISNVIEAVGSGSISINKQWASVLDQKTRRSHVSADGQEKSIGEPFIVGGEMLKHPGDTSLGASAVNTINCRCSSLYTN